MGAGATAVYWQQSDKKPGAIAPAGDVVDLAFRIRCQRLPVDHAWPLCSAVHRVLPWLVDEPLGGIHLVHGAESGNGWQRPGASDYLVLPRRTRLTLRVRAERRQDAGRLSGALLAVGEQVIEVGEATEKPLVPSRTVFSRHVPASDDDDEEAFIESVAEALRVCGIEPRKILCGLSHSFATPNAAVHARSVLVGDLEFDESIEMQRRGIGDLGAFGMGLFLPHKGIDAVVSPDDEPPH